MPSDRIEKQIVVKAPRAKVWRALTEAKQFAAWFGMEMEGEFQPGTGTWGVSRHPGYEGRFEMRIEEMTPESRFSWRWHPGSPAVDYSQEPATLVVFELSEVTEGTLATVTESGFEGLPPERRQKAYEDNSQGWAIQLSAIGRYVEANP